MGPGAHKVLFVPSKSLFPQFSVSSGGSMVGLMVTSSKRVYATPRSDAPRNGMDLTEAEDINKRWQEHTEDLYTEKI